jgi:hypothetical protein
MCAMPVSLDAAVEASRTGDLWLFRGRTPADRAIQTLTNSPVNHVGMALVLEDMPPMIWHAELGRSLPDRWTGDRHRGVQLHDLRAAVEVWGSRYGQRAWLRQLEPEVSAVAEDAALRIVARLDGVPFPSTAQLAGRWLRGRLPAPGSRVRAAGRAARSSRQTGSADPAGAPGPQAQAVPEHVAEPWHAAGEPASRRAAGDAAGDRAGSAAAGRLRGLARRARVHLPARPVHQPAEDDGGPARGEGGGALETAYCAEVVALTYQAMGLLAPGRRPSWYDPGRFWSGDDLPLTDGYALGAEIAVEVPTGG